MPGYVYSVKLLVAPFSFARVIQLHASDLRALEPSCHVAKSLSGAPSSLKFAYVESGSHHANPFRDLAGDLAKRCGSHSVSHTPDLGGLEVDAGKGRHVVSISLPALEDGEEGASRKSSMAEHRTSLVNPIRRVLTEATCLQSRGCPGNSRRSRPHSPTT